MAKELAKQYDPSEVEDRTYKFWCDKKYFHAKREKNKKTYTIVIPPPNITGQLHMGHALDNTLQDILVRYHRMAGYDTLWLPGTDHASIATEAKIVEYIYESCLEGATPAEIAAALTEQGIKSPKGKDFWRAATIRGILRNEKYCGDALMQKTCTIDFREHKSVKNTMLNKYFKEEHHTAIIKKSDWQKVQQILDEKPLPGKSARLHAMPKRFTVTRSKDKYFRGYIILDPRWTASERRELLKELKNL